MGSRNFGQLEEFNPRTDSFWAYVEKANFYFETNGISEENQLPIFLSSIGGKIYGLLRNFLEPLADYIAELCCLMTHCAFGEYLEDAL